MFSSNASQVSNDVKYIEDVCSVYLRTGTGSSQTVTTGIKENTGALVISKSRSAATDWAWYDTFRGATYDLVSNSTAAQTTQSQGLTSFNADGHTWGTLSKVNTSGATYVDTVLKPTPKFFDVVTYTGAGDGTTVSHNLGSTPGCVIVKATSGVDGWFVYHKDLLSAPPTNRYLKLNTTDATAFLSNWISVSDTTITFPTAYGPTAGSGTSYVAYLFAHDAGGFGLTGTDNVISCGSYVEGGAGTSQTINLGYEAQWLLVKPSSSANSWYLYDTMRGFSQTDNLFLRPNTSNADTAGSAPYLYKPDATGFIAPGDLFGSGTTVIYIAIRRGPMKVPTSGTSVFSAKTMTATRANLSITGVGFSPDMVINGVRSTANYGQQMADRLRGVTQNLFTEYNFTEYTYSLTALKSLDMDGISIGTDAGDASGWNFDTGDTSVKWMFKRAPSVFDIVCYTGTQTAGQTFSHNLGAVPEMMLVKSRSGSFDWQVYHSALGASKRIYINSTLGASSNTSAPWNDTTPTSTIFTLGNASQTNGTGDTFVNYLFATCAGVSKVGSYTGTGALLTVDCGFTSGARFILIKRTDSTGDWFTYDSTRGITSGNDPYMRLNSAAVEVTGTNYVDTDSTGFKVTAAAPAGLNASGGTYIFLAFA